MKSTPDLIKGELYHLMSHLVFPAEKRYSKDFYDRKFFIHVARTLQNELPDHVINASETTTDYILRIDLPTEKKGLIEHEPTHQNSHCSNSLRTHFNRRTEPYRRC